MNKNIDTAKKAWDIVRQKSNERFNGICREYDTAFCFRTAMKNHRIFVMKDTGDAFWEEEIPKDIFPKNIIKVVPFR